MSIWKEIQNRKIILYGAGTQNLRMAYQPIVSAGLYVTAVIDKDYAKQGKYFYGIKIRGIGFLSNFDKENDNYFLVITIRTNRIVCEVKEQLSFLKNARIYTFDEFIQGANLNCHVRRLSCVMTHLVDHCNLNCVRCSHFSTLDTNRSFYLDEGVFENDCKQLYRLVGDSIDEFQLSGGETLLHPYAWKFPYLVKKHFAKSHIIIITNGTLILKQPSIFFESCRNNNVQLWISKYPINFDYKSVFRKLEEEKINYMMGNSGNSEEHPKEMWGLPLYIKGGLDGKLSFRACLCMQYILRNGRLYPCANSAYIDLFNNYFHQELPGPECNSVNIYGVDDRIELLSKISKSIPLCEYCDSRNRKPGIPWKVSNKEIDEWTLG